MDRAVTRPAPLPVVAFVTHSAELSGAELFVLRIAAAAVRIQPLVVLGEHGPIEAVLDAHGVDHVVLPLTGSVQSHTERTAPGVPGLGSKVSGVALAARRLARLLREREVAVVTTHSAKAHVYGALAGRLARLPVVSHVHSVVGKEADRGANAVFLRMVLRLLPHGLIANSSATAASVLAPRVRARRTSAAVVVPCPVDLPSAVSAAPSVVSFVHAARVSVTKGQDVVLRAFARAREAGVDPAVRLRIVGTARFERDRAFADALPALAADLGVTDVVDFVGHSDAVTGEFARAAVALHASPVDEGFGQVIIEAMASGRPVIASAAGAPAELIEHDLDGVLVPPGDVDAMSAAMLRLAGDPGLRDRLGHAARVSAQRFRLDRIVDAWEAAVLPFVR